jgi:PAS domain S-box-containing protein
MVRNRYLRALLGPDRDPLLILLLAGSLVLLVFVGAGLAWLVEGLRSGRPLFSLEHGGPFGVWSEAWAVTSFGLFVGLGWSIWVLGRRRQLDQLRLRRSERRYRDIINHAGEAIFLLDGDGNVLEWNKAAEHLFAEPRRNVLNRPFMDIHLCYGMEITRVMDDSARLNRSTAFEFPLRRRGQQENGEISLTVSPIAQGPAEAGGRADAFVVIARDITSEKRMEARMSETEKLAGIGQFAAGIAHQLNTPLGSILLSAQMLEENVKSDDDVEDVQRIIRQTEQCRTIIKGLLNFARPSGSDRSRLSLREIVGETIFLMDKTIRTQNVDVRVDVRDEGLIRGNRNEIEQVIFNLLANSLDALREGGEIGITIDRSAQHEVELLFADTGPGVPAAYREQIFLPFFTTKDYGKGTGLGLSIVARLVHEHGGRIELLDGPGARFHMIFPAYREGGDAAPPVAGPEA